MANPTQLFASVVNYYSHLTGSNTGAYFPSFLRIFGYLTNAELGASSTLLSIFFDNLVPFFNNEKYFINNTISCSAGTKAVTCKYYPSNRLSKGQSYQNYARVDISFGIFPQGSTNEIHLLIPTSTKANLAYLNLFVATMSKDTRYTGKNEFYKIDTIFRITGGKNLQTNQIVLPLASSTLGTSYSNGLASINYGIDATGLKG
jgi:hypothetical protein